MISNMNNRLIQWYNVNELIIFRLFTLMSFLKQFIFIYYVHYYKVPQVKFILDGVKNHIFNAQIAWDYIFLSHS